MTLLLAIFLAAAGLRAEVREVTLTASAVSWEVAPGTTIAAYAYNGAVPGPELRFRPGDLVRVTLINDLPELTTIHWHGIAVPNGMDGVPGVTSPKIPPGGRFTYEFPAPEPGTYWYHPHFDSASQIARGLYGLLIVEPPAGAAPAYQKEVSLVIGEAGLDGRTMGVPFRGMDGSGMGPGMGGPGMGGPGMGSGGGGTMMGGGLLINGKTSPAIPDVRVRRGDRVLFRMVNTGNMVHPMHVHGMHWLVTASDGYDLSVPYRKDTLPVNAGERFDAVLDADNPGIWMIHCHNLMHAGDGVTGLAFRLIVE
ncbi:MAG: multicopper oxidase family protein [Thermoanaerobaculia bacterium]